MSDRASVRSVVLRRLQEGPATLADLRAAFPAGSAEARALPSMGERDAFGEAVAALVVDGLVIDEDGRYRLARHEDAGPFRRTSRPTKRTRLGS